jgi:hypothetical protein
MIKEAEDNDDKAGKPEEVVKLDSTMPMEVPLNLNNGIQWL